MDRLAAHARAARVGMWAVCRDEAREPRVRRVGRQGEAALERRLARRHRNQWLMQTDRTTLCLGDYRLS